jgi:hypothetical protein
MAFVWKMRTDFFQGLKPQDFRAWNAGINACSTQWLMRSFVKAES